MTDGISLDGGAYVVGRLGESWNVDRWAAGARDTLYGLEKKR